MESKSVTPTPKSDETDNRLETTPTPKDISTVSFSNDLKDYQILGEVGRGEYGQVYKCKYLNHIYALKIQDISNDDFSKFGNALIESDILARFRHPHLIGGFHSFFTKNPFSKTKTPIYSIVNVIEYAEKIVDIKYMASMGPLDLCLFLRQLLHGLTFLHSHGIIHGDLKPENLFLVGGVLKIGDFGLCQHDLPHVKSAAIHAVFYRPPEAFIINGPISIKSDIWAVGALLAEIITGVLGVFGSNRLDYPINIWEKLGAPSEKWLSKHDIQDKGLGYFSKQDGKGIGHTILSKSRFRENKQFSQLLSNILDKMLQIEPEKRESAQELLANPLFQLLPQIDVPRGYYYSGKEEIIALSEPILSQTMANDIITFCRDKKIMETTIILALDLAHRYFSIKSYPDFTFEESITVFACIASLLNEPFVVDVLEYLPKKQEEKVESRIMIRNIASVCYALDFRLYIDNIATVCVQDPKITLQLLESAYSKPKLLAKFYTRDFKSVCQDFWFIKSDF